MNLLVHLQTWSAVDVATQLQTLRNSMCAGVAAGFLTPHVPDRLQVLRKCMCAGVLVRLHIVSARTAVLLQVLR